MRENQKADRQTFATVNDLAQSTSDWIRKLALACEGQFAVCLSGGSTPRKLYEALAGRSDFPWPRSHWFWGDERFVPRDHPDSNYRMAHEALLSRVPIPRDNIHPIPTEGLSPSEAAAAYETTLKQFYCADILDVRRPLFNVTLLGIGDDGHTASLFPGQISLSERTRWVVDVKSPKDDPRITLTYMSLESAGDVAFLATGPDKQRIIARAWAGDQALPAARVTPVGRLHWIIDHAATPCAGGSMDDNSDEVGRRDLKAPLQKKVGIKRPSAKHLTASVGLRTLAIDVGGTHLKAVLLGPSGKMIVDEVVIDTPHPCPPKIFLKSVDRLIGALPPFERVSVGFPGFVRRGTVITAPHLGTKPWQNFVLADALEKRLGKPVRVLNDADVQGFGLIRGRGVEMVLTLGTGAGTALFRDGDLMPHLELAHHPIHKDLTYDEYIGDEALRSKGVKKWSRRVHKAITILRSLVHYDLLHIGGGNASKVIDPPADVKVGSNQAGLTGGIRLWDLDVAQY
jgi:6-phosphogluconolactonase